jgi:hypothetical protein
VLVSVPAAWAVAARSRMSIAALLRHCSEQALLPVLCPCAVSLWLCYWSMLGCSCLCMLSCSCLCRASAGCSEDLLVVPVLSAPLLKLVCLCSAFAVLLQLHLQSLCSLHVLRTSLASCVHV